MNKEFQQKLLQDTEKAFLLEPLQAIDTGNGITNNHANTCGCCVASG